MISFTGVAGIQATPLRPQQAGSSVAANDDEDDAPVVVGWDPSRADRPQYESDGTDASSGEDEGSEGSEGSEYSSADDTESTSQSEESEDSDDEDEDAEELVQRKRDNPELSQFDDDLTQGKICRLHYRFT